MRLAPSFGLYLPSLPNQSKAAGKSLPFSSCHSLWLGGASAQKSVSVAAYLPETCNRQCKAEDQSTSAVKHMPLVGRESNLLMGLRDLSFPWARYFCFRQISGSFHSAPSDNRQYNSCFGLPQIRVCIFPRQQAFRQPYISCEQACNWPSIQKKNTWGRVGVWPACQGRFGQELDSLSRDPRSIQAVNKSTSKHPRFNLHIQSHSSNMIKAS